jgi:long-chain acyl-CoA synthetase
VSDETLWGLPIIEIAARLTQPGQPFEMREIEVSGQRLRTWAATPESLRTVFTKASASPDRAFLVSDSHRWTFRDHQQAVTAAARHLSEEIGVDHGDRVAIAMRNWPEWSVAFWAAVSIGAVAVPLNSWWTSSELAFALEDCEPVSVVVDEERLTRVRAGLPPSVRSVLVARRDGAAGAAACSRRAKYLDSVIEGGRDLCEGLPDATVAADDIATIFYTSGTTGRPKGVIGTHLNLCTNLLSRAFWRTCHQLSLGEPPAGAAPAVSLLTVPLFHVTGCLSYLLPSLEAGSTLVLMDRWDAAQALRLIETERVSTVGGVPATVLGLIDAYDPATHDLSSLKSITVGGAPNPPALFERIHRELPSVTLGNGYGMTETSSVAIYNIGRGCLERPESIGRIVAVMDGRVVQPDGLDAPVGSPGELWLRGPNVTPGYWRYPEATEQAKAIGGWLKTGDLVTLDEDGFFTLVGRNKEIIVRGGENVSPVEIEAALYGHPAVADAGVVGRPHPVFGEEVVGYVQLRYGSQVTSEDLRQYLASRLAHFKVPARIIVMSAALPRSPQGKLLRQELSRIGDPGVGWNG